VGWEIIVAAIDAAAPLEAPEIAGDDNKKRTTPKPDAAATPAPIAREDSAPPSDPPADTVRESETVAPENVAPDAPDAPPPADDPPIGEGKVVPFPEKGRQKRSARKDTVEQDAAPAEPRDMGFSMERMNSEFALVLMGSRAVVFLEQSAAPIEDQKRVLAIDAFKVWFSNRFTEYLGADGHIHKATWANRWLVSRERRSYRGVEFFPDPDNAPGTENYLNLWSGFAFTPAPAPDPQRYKTFRDHLFNNVAQGNPALFKWVFGFFAHIVQRPRERLGVALVLRGRMGTGKTKIGEVFGALFPRHYFLVDDPRYVTGQFNAHMAACLLLQADEAVWAGDKAAEGRLKGLITSPIQQIEAKGIDPIRLTNYVRLVMTSNEDWVVPAGKDERRFAVLDVDPRCAQQHEYFREMDAELNAGGYEHLLGDLMRFDLESVDLRKVPRTAALLEQKLRSLDPVDSWWFGRLMAGAPTSRATQWQDLVPTAALYNDYLLASEKIGVKRKLDEASFGIKLKKIIPDLPPRLRRTVEIEDEKGHGMKRDRVYCYALPPLQAAREHFAQSVNQPIEWPPDDAGTAIATDSAGRDSDIVDF
jgi:hypothetical protein